MHMGNIFGDCQLHARILRLLSSNISLNVFFKTPIFVEVDFNDPLESALARGRRNWTRLSQALVCFGARTPVDPSIAAVDKDT